ncbi:MAG TPA: phospholipase D-like domain-containing protein [bacterium]|nr:phospholipase D-like domain-containing protein [bacterium]
MRIFWVKYLYKPLVFFFFLSLFLGIFLIPKIISILQVPLLAVPYSQVSLSVPLDFEIFFTNTASSPKYIDTLVSAIDLSVTSIDMAMYSFNSKELVEALKNASQRGVDITLVINHDHVKRARELFGESYFPIKILPEKKSNFPKHTGSMHHKFVLIDGETLIASSLNATDIQNDNDIGYVLVTKTPEIVQEYIMEFSRLESGLWGLAKIDDINYHPFSKIVYAGDDYFEIWWSPGLESNSIRGRILSAIESAETTLQIICWQITDQQIMDALLSKAREGVEIHVIMDQHPFLSDEMSSFMKNPLVHVDINEDTVDGSLKSFIHEHVLIVDGTSVLFGTNNWSNRGALSNDESIFYTNNKYLVNMYLNHFSSLLETILSR